MNVLIINPPRVRGSPVVREERYEHSDTEETIYPPHSLLYTAAILENKSNIKFIDANGMNYNPKEVINRIGDFRPSLIVSRFAFDTMDDDLRFLNILKKRFSAKLIVRCTLVNDIPKIKNSLIKKYSIDYFADIELESIFFSLNKKELENLKFKGVTNKSLKKIKGCVVEDINKFPFPAYHLIEDWNHYVNGSFPIPSVNIIVTRGCPYQCTFCAYGKKKVRFRKPENVIDELKYLISKIKIRSFRIFDDTSTLNKKNFIKICELIVRNNIRMPWTSCTRVDVLDEDIVKAMKKAGCVQMGLGLETGSQKILDNIKKGTTVRQAEEAIRLAKKYRIRVYALMVLGLPGETKETIRETIDFLKKTNPTYAQFTIATPLPNTEMFKEYDKKGYIITKDWSRYNMVVSPVISLPNIPTRELIMLRRKLYREYVFRPAFFIEKIKYLDFGFFIYGLKRFFKLLLHHGGAYQR